VSDSSSEIQNKKAELAKTILKEPINADHIKSWSVPSALLKRGGGTMPYVVRRDKISGIECTLPPSEIGLYKLQEWCSKNMLPAEITTSHFFVDSDKLKIPADITEEVSHVN
jgi:hypothetical protein